MKPMWSEIEEEISKLKTKYFDADENPEVLEKHGVKDIPVFIFLDKDENELFRLNGIQNKEDLIKAVKENINK